MSVTPFLQSTRKQRPFPIFVLAYPITSNNVPFLHPLKRKKHRVSDVCRGNRNGKLMSMQNCAQHKNGPSTIKGRKPKKNEVVWSPLNRG